MQKKNGDISSIEDVDRSLLWKMARQNNKGEYVNEDVKEMAEKIVSCLYAYVTLSL